MSVSTYSPQSDTCTKLSNPFSEWQHCIYMLRQKDIPTERKSITPPWCTLQWSQHDLCERHLHRLTWFTTICVYYNDNVHSPEWCKRTTLQRYKQFSLNQLRGDMTQIQLSLVQMIKQFWLKPICLCTNGWSWNNAKVQFPFTRLRGKSTVYHFIQLLSPVSSKI
jgi:hypothetical protein